MEEFNLASILYLCIVIGLIVLFVISFMLFIRRILINTGRNKSQLDEIQSNLEKIINLLEKDKKSN